jgi:hypothetical protein
MTFAIGGNLHANGWDFRGVVDPTTGELTQFGQRVAAGKVGTASTATLAYARLVGLVESSDPSSDRPTMPPAPTCHHSADGLCEHMVCPRTLADPHFTPEYYRRYGW